MDKILFADDEPDILNVVKSILTKEGYEVILAKDGGEAIKLTKANNPDLVILDYLMPVMDGASVAVALKNDSQTRSIPIIMITAYPQEKEKSLSSGAMDFITKPIDKIDLMLRIKSVLKVKHIKNELQKIIAYIAELEK